MRDFHPGGEYSVRARHDAYAGGPDRNPLPGRAGLACACGRCCSDCRRDGVGLLFLLYFRRKLAQFTGELCTQIDRMASGGEIEPLQYREELFSKLGHRLLWLYEVLRETRGRAERDREELQSLLSDISHQTKTPVSNLKMLNETLRTRELPPEKRDEMLRAVGSQLDKLDFFIQTMAKTSRLETGMIVLEKRTSPVVNTIVRHVSGGVYRRNPGAGPGAAQPSGDRKSRIDRQRGAVPARGV